MPPTQTHSDPLRPTRFQVALWFVHVRHQYQTLRVVERKFLPENKNRIFTPKNKKTFSDTHNNMLAIILQLTFCTTVLANTYHVDQYYTDNACTTVNWGNYEKFTAMGCIATSATMSERREKGTGGYNITTYTSANNCTGSITTPQIVQDVTCAAVAGSDGYKKTVWKTTVPLTAAAIPSGHVGRLEYAFQSSDQCNAVVKGGRYLKLGACDTARIDYAQAGKYSISTTDSTQIVYAYNCTTPQTPNPAFTTNCTDNKGQYYKGVIGNFATTTTGTAVTTTTSAAVVTTTSAAVVTTAGPNLSGATVVNPRTALISVVVASAMLFL